MYTWCSPQQFWQCSYWILISKLSTAPTASFLTVKFSNCGPQNVVDLITSGTEIRSLKQYGPYGVTKIVSWLPEVEIGPFNYQFICKWLPSWQIWNACTFLRLSLPVPNMIVSVFDALWKKGQLGVFASSTCKVAVIGIRDNALKLRRCGSWISSDYVERLYSFKRQPWWTWRRKDISAGVRLSSVLSTLFLGS